MVSMNRARRIAERIHEEISEMLIFDIHDPRLSEVSITDVTVDRELAYANIYFSSIQGAESAEQILSGFQHASGYIRSELARRIDLRTFPQLRFHWDPTPEHAEKIEKLLDSLSQQDKLTSHEEFPGGE